MYTMNIFSLFGLCYFIQLSNSLSFSNIFQYLGFRPRCSCRCGLINGGGYNLLDKLTGVEPIPSYMMPWFVFVHTNDSVIPGTLISDRHVITAASRVYDLSPSALSVQLGSNDFCSDNGLNFTVEAIVIPSGFAASNGNNDLALLRLSNEVPFNQYLVPICLPFSGRDYKQHSAIVSTAPSYEINSCVARASRFPLLRSTTCVTRSNYTLDKGCLGRIGSPQTILSEEDVGAPVMIHRNGLHIKPFRIIGVVSSASNDNTEPSLFTKIINHKTFIYQNIRNDCACN